MWGTFTGMAGFLSFNETVVLVVSDAMFRTWLVDCRRTDVEPLELGSCQVCLNCCNCVFTSSLYASAPSSFQSTLLLGFVVRGATLRFST